MRIDIITAVPSLFEGPLSASIVKRAIDKGFVEIVIHDLRDYSTNNYRQIDDYQFGGGAGMVMMAEPISKCIDKLQAKRKYDEIIYVTPDGKTYNQQCANKLSLDENLIILAGHYKGVDQRIRDIYVTKEISVGDFVLSGGEMPAAIIADSIIRLIPGVLGDETSALSDSFQDNLLAPPVYTRPSEFKGIKVPDVLMSGDHNKIEDWRYDEALKRTTERRPDLLSD
jgi:tRNA (guanine37-N1)-methyltransferase